jgi:hypothetical protein
MRSAAIASRKKDFKEDCWVRAEEFKGKDMFVAQEEEGTTG